MRQVALATSRQAIELSAWTVPSVTPDQFAGLSSLSGEQINPILREYGSDTHWQERTRTDDSHTEATQSFLLEAWGNASLDEQGNVAYATQPFKTHYEGNGVLQRNW